MHPAKREGDPVADVAAVARQRIEHVTPKRDFVGVAPSRLVDALVLDYRRVTGTSIAWPKETKLEPGTYFWRIVGIKDGRLMADSGRSAFVVQ